MSHSNFALLHRIATNCEMYEVQHVTDHTNLIYFGRP